jgi:hypothetical protein
MSCPSLPIVSLNFLSELNHFIRNDIRLLFTLSPDSSGKSITAIWTGVLRHKSVILSATLLGLILDSTGFAKPKVHAEGRFAS